MWHPIYNTFYKLFPSTEDLDKPTSTTSTSTNTPLATATATATISTSTSTQASPPSSPAGNYFNNKAEGNLRYRLPSIRTFSTLSPIQSVSSLSPITSISCSSSPAASVPPSTTSESPVSTISPLLRQFPSPPSSQNRAEAKNKDRGYTVKDADSDTLHARNNTETTSGSKTRLPAYILPLPSAPLAAKTLASAFSSFPSNPHTPRTQTPAPEIPIPNESPKTPGNKRASKTSKKTSAAYTSLVKAHILAHGIVISTGGDEGKPTHDAVALLLPPGAGPRSTPRRARNLTKGWGWRVYLRSGMWKGAVRKRLASSSISSSIFGGGSKSGCGKLPGAEGGSFKGIQLDSDLRSMKARMAGVMGFQAEETWMLTGLGTKVESRPFGLGGRAVEVCCDMVDAREKPLYTECFEYNVRFFEKYGFCKVGMVAMDPVDNGVILSMMVRDPDLCRFRGLYDHALDGVFASF